MNNPSTQQQIEIAGIKNGVVIMKDLSYRIVLEVASINFNLKSEMEQNSIVFQYQGFLNALHFPIEIVVRSKRLDLTPYLNHLKDIGEKQQNELIRSQTLDYVNFVGQLIDIANIMKKSFYIVVPYSPMNLPNANLFDKIFGTGKNPQTNLRITDKDFKANVTKLTERANIVASGIGSIGLRCTQLNTEALIELFYGVYNPAESGRERLTDFSTVSSPVISNGSATPDMSNRAAMTEIGMIDNVAQVKEQQKLDASAKQAKEQKTEEKVQGYEQFKTPEFLDLETQTQAGEITPQVPDKTSATPPATTDNNNQAV
ncbi:MAG: hypothetical protein WCG48_01765 [Candidatus Berkelbacteria bacterium]